MRSRTWRACARANASSSTRARAASAWRRSRSRITSARKSSPRAGSPTKRALLKTLGVKHVIDSRRGDFAEAVMELTDRRGVDVVLNALAAEAIPMGLSCLAEFGRFIEIGKRDIYQNSRIPLWPLRRNASFHVVAMDAVFSGDEALTRRDARRACRTGRERRAHVRCPSVPSRRARIDAAFRLMASGKHIGKVVVSFPEAFVPRRGEPLAPPFAIKPDGCYLITGAFGGFGKVLAEWLVKCGARHLVLSSRSGAATPEAEAFVQSLRDRGVERAGGARRRRFSRRCFPAARGNPRGRSTAARRISPRDGHRRRAARRAQPRAHADRDGAEGVWRMAAAQGHAAICRSIAS